jgi:EpsD family peptidyl-prolyl cis-trans isomerase
MTIGIATRTDGSGRASPLRLLALGSAMALVLAGCHKKPESGGKPTGQVVARLGKEDITQIEVNAELQGARIPPGMSRRDAEKMALSNILARRALAEVADERKLTNTPQFDLQKKRMEEQLKVQALARDIASKVAAPTRDEAIAFMDKHPEMFAQRKIFKVDQIQFLRPANLEKLGLRDIKTMAGVEDMLKANNIEYRRQPATIDPLAVNPDFIKEITAMLQRNPQELFMFANMPPGAPAPVMAVNAVTETIAAPFIGDKAIEFATKYEQNQRVQKALAAEVEAQQKAARARAVFQEGWEPAAPKAGAAAKSGAGLALPVPDEHRAPAVPGAPAAAAAAPAATAPSGG